jgi:ATP-dependent DNA helicase 2 subunit 2
LYIDVKRYFKVHQAKPVSASSFANSRFPVGDSAQLSGTLSADTDMPDASLTGMSAVKTTRNYQVNHHSGVGGKLDVPFEDLAKGYEYGSSVVPMEEGNKITTAFSSSRSFSIIGFIPSDKVN